MILPFSLKKMTPSSVKFQPLFCRLRGDLIRRSKISRQAMSLRQPLGWRQFSPRHMIVEMRKFCVYAIQSDVSGGVYIGQTDDLGRRLIEHNAGRVKFAKHEAPWKILAIEYFHQRSRARWCERCLKRSRGKTFRLG